VVWLADDVLGFVRDALPEPPARLLEVGAGGGELAEALRADGYDVVAIDPASESPEVRRVSLAELDEPASSFDAAAAIVSLHHVEPLAASCRHLASLVRPGGTLAVDEFDVEAFDEGAAGWWLANRDADCDHEATEPARLVADLRDHIHPLALVRETLGEWFALEEPTRGPYMHRWDMPHGLLDLEARLIAAGELPATGARMVGRRR
jgi:SAM-dependent methyltransferase